MNFRGKLGRAWTLTIPVRSGVSLIRIYLQMACLLLA